MDILTRKVCFPTLTSMKLKLRTSNIELLRKCLSQISGLRKFVILMFTTEHLRVISVSSSSLIQEPQIWCKFSNRSIFSEMMLESLQENNRISLEINVDLFLQALRNFDKANSLELAIRLQRKEEVGKAKETYLTLYYSDVSANASTLTHTFRIPVKVIKQGNPILTEPELAHVDLALKLPKDFPAIYKRLDKFKNSSDQDKVTIRSNARSGGSLDFIVSEAGRHKTTISWNERLQSQNDLIELDSDSLRAGSFQDQTNGTRYRPESENTDVSVRLKDWKMASKIVSTCEMNFLLLNNKVACALVCILEEVKDAEIVYYISGIKQAEMLSD